MQTARHSHCNISCRNAHNTRIEGHYMLCPYVRRLRQFQTEGSGLPSVRRETDGLISRSRELSSSKPMHPKDSGALSGGNFSEVSRPSSPGHSI